MKKRATFENLKYVSGGIGIKSTICTTAALGVVVTALYKNLKNEDNIFDQADKYLGQKVQKCFLDNFLSVNDKEDDDE